MATPVGQRLVLQVRDCTQALMEFAKLGIGGCRPLGGADAGRLVDLKISHAILAQAVPAMVRKPGRAGHGAGLVRGPETEGQAAPQLVAMLHEYARQFHLAQNRLIL